MHIFVEAMGENLTKLIGGVKGQSWRWGFKKGTQAWEDKRVQRNIVDEKQDEDMRELIVRNLTKALVCEGQDLKKYFFGGLECVGHFFAYVAHFLLLSRLPTRPPISLLATHLPTLPPICLYLATPQPPISLLANHFPYLATHLPYLATHLPLSHPSPF